MAYFGAMREGFDQCEAARIKDCEDNPNVYMCENAVVSCVKGQHLWSFRLEGQHQTYWDTESNCMEERADLCQRNPAMLCANSLYRNVNGNAEDGFKEGFENGFMTTISVLDW